MERYRSRHRSRNGFRVLIASTGGEQTVLFEENPYHTYDAFEAQRDVVGNKGGFNPVLHCKWSFSRGQRPTFTLPGMFGSPPTYYVFSGEWDQGTWNMFVVGVDGLLSLSAPGDVVGDWNYQIVKSITDQIPESVSIANFLIELREMKDLFKTQFGHLLQVIPHLILSWSFGVSPFLGDLQKMVTLLDDVAKRLEHLKKINHRIVTLRFKRQYNEDYTNPFFPPGTPVNWSENSPENSLIPMTTFRVFIYRYAVRVHYDLNLGGADVALRGLLAALGVTNPAKIVWNAIPYSFVVEWFHNLDSYLDSLEMQPFEGTAEILGSHHTKRCRAETELFAATNPDGGWTSFARQNLDTFERVSGMPPGSVQTEGLTPWQEILYAALASTGAGPHSPPSRRKRRRRRNKHR